MTQICSIRVFPYLQFCRTKQASSSEGELFKRFQKSLEIGKPQKCHRMAVKHFRTENNLYNAWRLLKKWVDAGVASGLPGLESFFTDLFKQNDLEAILKKKDPHFEDILVQAMREIDPATRDPKSYEKEHSEEAKIFLKAFTNFFPAFITTVLDTFSRFTDDKRADVWEAYQLTQVFLGVLTIPYALTQLLLAIMGPPWLVVVVTACAIFAVVSTLFAYVKWLQPAPKFLPDAENLTTKAVKRELPPVVEREGVIAEIMKCLSDREHPDAKMHVLLVGPPGVGKTTTIEGLAQRLCAERPKTQVFSINPLDLTSTNFSGETGAKIRELFRRVKGHERDIVFFADELHAAITQSMSAPEFLGKKLDEKSVMFIGATTHEGYAALKKASPSFIERFKVITISAPPSNSTELKRMVQHRVHFSSDVTIDDEAIDEAIKLCSALLNQRQEPRIAVQVLQEAINHVAAQIGNKKITSADFEQSRQDYEEAKKLYQMDIRRGRKPWKTSEQSRHIEVLKNRYCEEAKKIEGRRKELESLMRLRRQETKLIQERYGLARKIVRKKSSADIKKFLILKYLMIPRMHREIQRLENELAPCIDVKVNAELVKRIVNEKVAEMGQA